MTTSLVPYFGCKRKHAAAIVAEICRNGKPSYFAEPFCGSMAVSLAMPEVQTHLVNDLNGLLINLARVLSWECEGSRLISRLERTLCSESVYADACEMIPKLERQCVTENPLLPEDMAWAYAVREWLGPNGSPEGDERFCVRFGPGGGDPATRWRSAVESLGRFRTRLRRFTITNGNAFELLAGKIVDDPRSAVYVDPPYLRSTRGAGDYKHDFDDHGGGIFSGAEDDDHDKLAAALKRFAHARVVVSYYDDPRLDDLYPAPRWRKVVLGREDAGLANASGETGRDRIEVLLVNDGGER